MASHRGRPFLNRPENYRGLIPLALVHRRSLLQRGQQNLGAGRHRHGILEHDVLGTRFLPVEVLVGAALSGRNVEPSREIPANNPREREYERISARMVTSVSAEALRPTGPAAAEASPPNFTLLVKMLFADRGLISNSTKVRRVATQLQTRAATFQSHHRGRAPAAVKIRAATAGHNSPAIAASDSNGKFQHGWQNHHAVGLVQHTLAGMLSGALRISFMTVPAFSTRSTSLSWANAGNANAIARLRKPITVFFILSPQVLSVRPYAHVTRGWLIPGRS